MAALTTILEVGKYALIGTVTTAMGIGIIARGVETVQHTQSLFRADDEKATWQKVRDLALTLIELVGITSITLVWAQFWGWISLGGASAVFGFISYPAFAIVYTAQACKEYYSLYRLLQQRETPFFKWKVAAKVIHSLSKTSLVAASVLGGIAFVSGCAPIGIAALIAFIAAYLFLGSAKVFDHNIAAWERVRQPAVAQ